MNRLEEIKERLDKVTHLRGNKGFDAREEFESCAEADIDYLLSLIEQKQQALDGAFVLIEKYELVHEGAGDLIAENDELMAQLDGVYAHNVKVSEMLKRDFPAAYAKVMEMSLIG